MSNTAKNIGAVMAKSKSLLAEKGITRVEGISLLQVPYLGVILLDASTSEGHYLIPAVISNTMPDVEKGRVYKDSELLDNLKNYALGIKDDIVR